MATEIVSKESAKQNKEEKEMRSKEGERESDLEKIANRPGAGITKQIAA